MNGDPSLLLVFVPVICVVATGHVVPKEGFVRAGISVLMLAFAGVVMAAIFGKRVPALHDLGTLLSAGSGVFAMNLVLIVAASAVLRRIWPQSDHWTL